MPAEARTLHVACRDIEALAERLSQPAAGTSALAFESEHAQGLLSQYSILLRKNIIAYWRCTLPPA